VRRKTPYIGPLTLIFYEKGHPMTTFDDRDKAFENKYALDEELSFKATARRNKLLGLWAAERLGKAGEAAEQYAKDVVIADFEVAGDDDVVDKLLKDFANAGISIDRQEIRGKMDQLLNVARKQILGENN
jgi:hypothetical protein